MSRRVDLQTNTVEDAAEFEHWQAADEWMDDRPTKAELDRDEWGAR